MIEANSVNNMAQLLDALERESGSRVIAKYMTGPEVHEVSAPDFFEAVRRCAGALQKYHLTRKHIGIMGANRCQWLIHFCAVYQIGAVAVLLSPDLNERELARQADQADLCCILHDEELAHLMPPGVLAMSMDAAYGNAHIEPIAVSAEPEELACILFTSGTTAMSKAVMLSHRAMIAGVCHNVIGQPFEAQLAILPMHHVAGFATVLNTWYLGRVVCLGQDMKYLYRYLECMKPDYTLTVPSVLQVILKKLKNAGPNGKNLGWNLRMIGCGGAKFQPEVIQALNDQNIIVLQSYGATEAGGLGFDWVMTPQCRDTIGKPCPQIETKIVDGELYLRSESVMMGYYKDEAATRQVLRDGWYATGDLAEQDEKGYLYLRGRKKNLIILSNGENVSPEEIESRLAACDRIQEVMVGLEEDLITATVFPRHWPDSTPEQIRARIAQALEEYNASVPPYKQVMNLRFSDVPFAKTAVGKMIRHSVTGVNQQ